MRRLLAERKMSLRALSARVGVDPGFLVRVLQGKQRPSERLISGVNDAFDLAPDHFVETRRAKLVELMLASPDVVDAFYNQIASMRPTASTGAATPGTREPPDDPLTILTTSEAGDPRVARLAAAILFRYRRDKSFRRAVDAELPQIEKLAQNLDVTS